MLAVAGLSDRGQWHHVTIVMLLNLCINDDLQSKLVAMLHHGMLGNSHVSGCESILQGTRTSCNNVCESIGVGDDAKVRLAIVCDNCEACQDCRMRGSLLNKRVANAVSVTPTCVCNMTHVSMWACWKHPARRAVVCRPPLE